MKKTLLALAVLGALSFQARATVICDTCSYVNGQVATNLGLYNPVTFDNGTFGNSTTGTNGDFDNTWIFSLNPAGKITLDAIFLPIGDISNFGVKLFSVISDTCAANTATTGGACTTRVLGSQLATGVTNPSFATVIDFTTLAAGTYAFDISGTISGLAAGEPASYTGNLQVAAVPEPDILALCGAGLMFLGWVAKRKNKAG